MHLGWRAFHGKAIAGDQGLVHRQGLHHAHGLKARVHRQIGPDQVVEAVHRQHRLGFLRAVALHQGGLVGVEHRVLALCGDHPAPVKATHVNMATGMGVQIHAVPFAEFQTIGQQHLGGLTGHAVVGGPFGVLSRHRHRAAVHKHRVHQVDRVLHEQLPVALVKHAQLAAGLHQAAAGRAVDHVVECTGQAAQEIHQGSC